MPPTMQRQLENIMADWYISYSPYSGIFQIYDDAIFGLPKSFLSEKRKNNYKVVLEKESLKPLLLEIREISGESLPQFENLEKKDILRLIIPLFEGLIDQSYGKEFSKR